MLKLDLSHVNKEIDFASYSEQVSAINGWINDKTAAGGDFLGWVNWPDDYDKEEFERIQKAAEYIRANFDVLVVVGIGGSYLGARAAIEAINGMYPNSKTKVIFMGQTMSSIYTEQTLDFLKDKKFAINVISKSGTTTEPAVAFRVLKSILEERMGKEEASKAIFATTDKSRGALKQLSTERGYETYVIPDDIGGRYSVFTAVGLLPMAVAGIDIKQFMEGASLARKEYDNADLDHNDCYRYAVARHQLYVDGYKSEMFVSWEPQIVMLGEWLKQLYGESEGKEGTGLLPTSATFTTDLHSLGQFIQEGSKILFETVLNFEERSQKILIGHDEDNLDNLNYLEGKSLSYINRKAMEGTIDAHSNVGGVPNIVLTLQKLDAKHLGFYLYFHMRACAMSCYLNGINPFNQPGVEIYKKNMFHLLGKPGF